MLNPDAAGPGQPFSWPATRKRHAPPAPALERSRFPRPRVCLALALLALLAPAYSLSAEPAGFETGRLPDLFFSSSHWRAFAAGVANTARASLAGILLASALGLAIGVGLLSGNAAVRRACGAYVAAFRNLPVLLQLLLWYLLFMQALPPAGQALSIGSAVFLSTSGLSFPWPVWAIGHLTTIVGLAAGYALAAVVARRARAAFEAGAGTGPSGTIGLGILLGCALSGWLAGGAPLRADMPQRSLLEVSGGATATPEMLAVVLGLSFHAAALIAGILRSSLRSVPRDQIEAADALGLPRRLTLRLVTLPQARRMAIRPLAHRYLKLIRNSSLAVVVAYPDLLSISSSTLDRTGRTLECVSVMLAIYLSLWLLSVSLTRGHGAGRPSRDRPGP